MVNAQTRPLVVCDQSGTPFDLVFQNDKGFRKTLESGHLWSLHSQTNRLLPYSVGPDPQISATIEDRGSWYLATLAAPGESPSDGGAIQSETAPPSARSSTEDAAAEDAAAGDAVGAALGSLVNVIRDRRRRMPEGSYTTHLFTAGKAKIRKKTGEEAVELILAADRAELTSEAADFIYHLLVLLEVEGVSLDEIAEELKRR